MVATVQYSSRLVVRRSMRLVHRPCVVSLLLSFLRPASVLIFCPFLLFQLARSLSSTMLPPFVPSRGLPLLLRASRTCGIVGPRSRKGEKFCQENRGRIPICLFVPRFPRLGCESAMPRFRHRRSPAFQGWTREKLRPLLFAV